jgi:hypothetical protein
MKHHRVNDPAASRPPVSHLLYFTLLLVVLTVKQAEANSPARLKIQASPTDLWPQSTLHVTLLIENAADLYGFQVNCRVDPAVLAWKSSQFVDFFGDPLVGFDRLDPDTGTWIAAVSRRNPAPAVSGNGIFARLSFEAIGRGVSPLSCEPLASDRDGAELAVSTGAVTITVRDPAGLGGIILGDVSYQGRQRHSGIEVVLAEVAGQKLQTDETGQFQVTRLSDGAYTLQADAARHLPACATVTVSQGQVTRLDPAYLAGGDTDDNDTIRINDATLIGSNFGLTITSRPAMDSRADINGDDQVNIQDLAILGGNFGREGCQAWTSLRSLAPGGASLAGQ